MKPLIICGGCSFTHAPDSWAQVLGNYKHVWSDGAQNNHNAWLKYGREVAGVNMDHIPKNIYDVWDQGKDITQYADVMVVGIGASGNQLNSRIIRHAIEQNAGRQIIVLWQLSSWSRNEYALNKLESMDYDKITGEHDAHHMYAVLYANRFRNCAVIDGAEHDPEFTAGWGYRNNEEVDKEDCPEWTPYQYTSDKRVWLKQGGTYTGWENQHLYDFFKEDSINTNTSDNQSVKNLETVEYMKLFCDSKNVQLLTFPGWYWCWNGNFNFGQLERTLFSKDILDRIGISAVDDIDGYCGIAEWGLQSEVYTTDNPQNINPQLRLLSGDTFTSNETSSIYEKAELDNGEWWCGNHPSAYAHAKFCNEWIKPRVQKMIDNIESSSV